MTFFASPEADQVCSEARVANIMDGLGDEVSQVRFGVEDTETIVSDLFVIVEVGYRLGASMESEAVDRAVFMVGSFDIGLLSIEDITNVVGGDLVVPIVDDYRVVVGLPKVVLNPVAAWVLWVKFWVRWLFIT
jgi:hypothetical protein